MALTFIETLFVIKLKTAELVVESFINQHLMLYPLTVIEGQKILVRFHAEKDGVRIVIGLAPFGVYFFAIQFYFLQSNLNFSGSN